MSIAPVGRVQAVSAVADGAVLTTVVLYFSQVVGLAESTVGLAMSGAAAASLVLAPALGRVADRVGPHRTAAACALAVAAALAAYAVVEAAWAYVVATLAFGIGRTGIAAALQAIVAAATAPGERVRARARLHTLLNAGLGAGSVVGAVVLAGSRPVLFVALFSVGAVAMTACAVLLARLRVVTPAPPAATLPGRGRGVAVRDPRLLAVTGLTSVLLLTMPVLSVLLPVWLVTRTDAPAWTAAVAFGLNTALVVLLQSPWSGWVRTDRDAARSALAAGAALGAACALFAVLPYGGAVAASCLALIAVGVLTVGEVATGPAAWHLALRDTPADRQGEYQAVFGMSYSLARITGPLVALPVMLHLGSAGWLAIAGAMAAAAGGLAVVAARSGRRQPGGRSRHRSPWGRPAAGGELPTAPEARSAGA